MSGFASAASYPIPKQLPFDPQKLNVSDIKPDDGVEIQNFTSYIVYWNERMQWGFSEKQINEGYSHILATKPRVQVA